MQSIWTALEVKPLQCTQNKLKLKLHMGGVTDRNVGEERLHEEPKEHLACDGSLMLHKAWFNCVYCLERLKV